MLEYVLQLGFRPNFIYGSLPRKYRHDSEESEGTPLPDSSVDLSGLSDGELLDLAVPSNSLNRRVLVMWLYLKERPDKGLEEFDLLVATMAERELQRRAIPKSPNVE